MSTALVCASADCNHTPPLEARVGTPQLHKAGYWSCGAAGGGPKPNLVFPQYRAHLRPVAESVMGALIYSRLTSD